MNNIKPPIAEKIPYQIKIHKDIIHDDYHWLRSKDWPQKVTEDKILSYLKKENNYGNSFFNLLSKEKKILFTELKNRIKLNDKSTYIKKDNYYYYTKTNSNSNYTIYCRKKWSTKGKEEIILDTNKLTKCYKFISISDIAISIDHQLLAYSIDYTGGEKYTIKIIHLTKKEYLKDEISNTIGNIIWTDNGFFYTPIDNNWRVNKVKYHQLGTDPKQDQIVFYEKDSLYSVSINKSSSKEYIFINVSGHESNEIYYLNIINYKNNCKNNLPTLIKKRINRINYTIDHNAPYFYLHINEKAKNFYILRTKSKDFNKNNKWSIFIPHKKTQYLSSFDLTKKHLLLNYKKQGIDILKIVDLQKKLYKTILFSDQSYTATIYSTNFEENDIRVSYSSLVQPHTTYKYDIEKDSLLILKTTEIPSGFNSNDYKTERIFAINKGVKIPISILYKKSLFKKNGLNPLYLYGYGSYGIGISPAFNNKALSLANRGFIYAIAHIRGGDDLGQDWYEAAKYLNKKNSFDDFIAAAEILIKKKYTSKNNIIIAGGSAGGMLISNVINQKPDLFKAAIAHVPFVDVLNTMLDETLPLTPQEFKEWGNPKEKIYFDYIKSYCPYSNIKKQPYPHIFVTAGLNDPRVGYWEAAKWVAKLRNYKTNNNIIILKTNMNFGHQGASGRFNYLQEISNDLVFIFYIFNIPYN